MIISKEASTPKIAVLASYHGKRAAAFAQAGDSLKRLAVELIHPPSGRFNLLNPDDHFVIRDGDDPNTPNHLLQIQELRRMRELRQEELGNGFGYVVNEDNSVGMHTAGEMAFLALHSIPVTASKPLEAFRDVPRCAQDTLRKTIQAILPIDEITQQNITALQGRLAQEPPPSFSKEERAHLSKLVGDALLEQRFGDQLYRAMITSKKDIKYRPFKSVLEKANQGKYVALDRIQTHLPNMPEQPFQKQGEIGAISRIYSALNATAGFPYNVVGSFENFIAALDPKKYNPETWATPDQWATPEDIRLKPEQQVYADTVCFAYIDLQSEKIKVAYSKPVVIPTDIALEALRRGPNTLYASVLQEKDPRINLDDPQSSLGRYSRAQQLLDVAQTIIR